MRSINMLLIRPNSHFVTFNIYCDYLQYMLSLIIMGRIVYGSPVNTGDLVYIVLEEDGIVTQWSLYKVRRTILSDRLVIWSFLAPISRS